GSGDRARLVSWSPHACRLSTVSDRVRHQDSTTAHRDVAPASTAKPITPSSGRRVIAVIGIDHYRSWPELGNAVSDACGARSLFQTLDLQELTAPLLDEHASGAALHRLVTDDLMGLDPGDSLVLFYAGHGGTRTQKLQETAVTTGYLIPSDADAAPDKVA